MKALKFKLFTPTGIFKTPFSLKGIETYPLPPYSTIIGLLYTALGRKWQGETFSLSVQGKYEAIFRDYIRFRKYNKKDRILETLPLEVPVLYNLEVLVHVVGEEELLKDFEKALKRPSSLLFLSGGEYPVKVYHVKLVEVKEEKVSDYEVRDYNALVPQPCAERLSFSKGKTSFLVPSFLKSIKPREYHWLEVYYLQKNSFIDGRVYIDEEGSLLWL